MPKNMSLMPVNEKLAKAAQFQQTLLSFEESQLEALFDLESEFVEPLLTQICQDDNPSIARKASIILQNLRNTATIKTLCQQIIVLNNPLVNHLVSEAGYAPTEPRSRALFYFLTEQWDKYDNLDFDQSLLRSCYEIESEPIRRQISQLIRTSGRTDLLKLIVERPKKARLANMSHKEWELTIETLTKAEQWAELWQWAKISPSRYSMAIVRALADNNWQPTIQVEEFHKLASLASVCQTSIPPLERLMSEPKVLDPQCRQITAYAFSPTDNLVAISAFTSHRNNNLEFWDVKQGVCVKRLTNFFRSIDKERQTRAFGVDMLAYSPNGDILACWVSGAGGIWLLHTRTYNLIKILKTLPFEPSFNAKYSLGFNNDGSELVSVADTQVCVWSIPDGKLIRSFETTLPRYNAEEKVTLNHDASLIAKRWGAIISLWETSSGKLLKDWYGIGTVIKLDFSPDDRFLIASNVYEDDVRQPITIIELASIDDPLGDFYFNHNTDPDIDTFTLFTQDNQTLVRVCNQKLEFWHLWHLWGSYRTRLISEIILPTAITNIKFSPNGQYLAGVSTNQLLFFTSRLTKLSNEIGNFEDLLWVQETLKGIDTTKNELQWLRYIEAQLKLRFEHEIELDGREIEAHEHDIELGE